MTNLNKQNPDAGVPVVHAQHEQLPIREEKPKQGAADPPPYDAHTGPVDLQLHHIASKDALFVKIQPPKEPSKPISHVACDVVLVIDVSGSMCSAAPVPGEGAEETGLSVLDLTKHAAFTIIETMDERDRLGIVTFETESKVVQWLEPMTDGNKEEARKRVKALKPMGSTNLWHGMLDAIKLFNKEQDSHRVPAMMVLTDGEPNHMCPSKGYIPKLRSMPPLPATIHTFGFGYSLRSGLLKSIAEFSGGNYAFIPDAGMIGTVFVHAIANLQSTFATKASLKLKYAATLEIAETVVDTVDKHAPVNVGNGQKELTISLGNIQYGQSRDLWLRFKGASQGKEALVEATLTYEETEKPSPGLASARLGDDARGVVTLSDNEVVFHESRALVCKFISSLFPLASDGEYRALTAVNEQTEHRNQLVKLIESLPGRELTDDLNKALMDDLKGAEPRGQISIALSTPEYFIKWGRHFLPSYVNALSRQICNSFKDATPLQFGSQSPLFIACRDRLDNAFDNIPAPEPSRVILRNRGRVNSSGTTSHASHTTMARYRNSSGVCFAGSTTVELASGKMTEIKKLKSGIRVRTPLGPRKVVMVLKTKVSSELLYRIGSLLVTPWHPLSMDGKNWDFPANMSDIPVLYTGFIYSVLLQPDRRSDAHAIRVADTWGVTLGHGILRGAADVRAHEFFGDYMRVRAGLMKLEAAGRKGVVKGGGIERDPMTGLVRGFRRLSENAPIEKIVQV
ncbi:MFS permease [Trichoderma guizhouense]|uniref:MFS permease n=1 Tax=Trichoderma guizhouense TaxID=1491466 RepID=A0A1T3C689_9HYPO|nr:MFS permease [Trichoderma guizhouense]